jgi:hypothetical protein
LQLDENAINHIRYQLLHRSASAVIEARRFNAQKALMMVHYFGQLRESANESFQDYCRFLELFGKHGRANSLVLAKNIRGVNLYLGWVKGGKKYLDK